MEKDCSVPRGFDILSVEKFLTMTAVGFSRSRNQDDLEAVSVGTSKPAKKGFDMYTSGKNVGGML